ncbi:MAG: DUF1349 domain-containing protein [Planctomycetes bacterium]|nr:DUF1349 domain-containing protein [Planctomycetota bacterium]
MIRAMALVLAVCVAWPPLLIGGGEKDEQVLFKDDFSSSLSDGWSWVREDPKAWRLGKGKLEIRSLPGGLWREKNVGKNILLRTPPDAKNDMLMIEVKIHSQPKELFENAGIIWYYDDDNYVILNKEFYDRKPGPGVQMVREVKQKSSVPKHAPFEGDQVCLRLLVSGKVFTGQYRKSEKDAWQTVGECDLPVDGKPKVGLIASYGPKDAERWVQYSNFRILKRAKQ